MLTEPVAVNTAIKEALSSVLKVVIIMGLWQITTEQFGALMLAIDPVLAVIFLIWNARRQSTSIEAPRVPVGTPVTSYDPTTGQDVATTTAPAG